MDVLEVTMNKGILEVANNGIPIRESIFVKSYELINISDNHNKTKEVLEYSFNRYMSFVRSLFPKYGTDMEFYMALEIKSKNDEGDKKIVFSYNSYIRSICDLLRMKNLDSEEQGCVEHVDVIVGDEEVMLAFSKERCNALRKITTLDALKEEFPAVYEKGIKLLEKVEPYSLMLKDRKVSKHERKMIRTSLEKAGLLQMLDKNFEIDVEALVNRYVSVVEVLIKERERVKTYLNSHEVDISAIEIKEEVLELFLAERFLTMAEQVDDDLIKQRYLYYVSYYFNNNQDKINSDLRIEIPELYNDNFGEGMLCNQARDITPCDLYLRYREFLIKNPKVQIVDFDKKYFEGFDLNDVEEFMNIYFKDLRANWDFFDGTDDSFDQVVISDIVDGDKNRTKSSQEHLVELYMAKKEFFDLSDPRYRIKGKKTFNGYIGYIYPNGKVVLEKFFNNSDKSALSDGNAIYVMDIVNFYELSQKSKSTLIAENLCHRYVHRGNWQEKVAREINSQESFNPTGKVKELMKANIISE